MARRLVPARLIERFMSSRLQFQTQVTSEEVAEHFNVTNGYAVRAMRLLELGELGRGDAAGIAEAG